MGAHTRDNGKSACVSNEYMYLWLYTTDVNICKLYRYEYSLWGVLYMFLKLLITEQPGPHSGACTQQLGMISCCRLYV